MVVSGGALLIITAFADDLPGLVDLATTVAFVSAPLYAYLNYRAVTHPSILMEHRPPSWLRVFARVGLICLASFSLFFLVWRFF